MEYPQSEMTPERWEELRDIAQKNVCSVCGAELQVHTVPETAAVRVGCLNRAHRGFVQAETYTQAYRRGVAVHPAIAAKIEDKTLVITAKSDLGRAMNMLALRYPSAIQDTPTAALFINDCLRLGLDPLIQPSEAVPLAFRNKVKDKEGRVIDTKVSIVMHITEDGWLSMAARGCPDKWAGAPAVEPVKDKALAESLCGDPDAWLWKATGRTKDMAPGQSSTAYGFFTTRDFQAAQKSGTPAASMPGNQARVRAVRRWVRENFPDCRQNMIQLTQEWYSRAGEVEEAKKFIDAEYTILQSPDAGEKVVELGHVEQPGGMKNERTFSPERGSPPKNREVPPAAPVPTAGFIDLAWISETLKALKWSEDTAKSWISSNLKVDIGGKFTEVLARLTREQAERFAHDLEQRIKVQPGLFS